jgi:AMMECR1 domain-containing protein
MDGELVRLLGDAVVYLAVDAAVRVLRFHPVRREIQPVRWLQTGTSKHLT